MIIAWPFDGYEAYEDLPQQHSNPINTTNKLASDKLMHLLFSFGGCLLVRIRNSDSEADSRLIVSEPYERLF